MNKVSEIIWKDITKDLEIENLIEKVIQKCFEVECISPTSLYICITLTNPENIKKLNKKYRDIDKPTDVLSFPMFEKSELEEMLKTSSKLNNQAELKPEKNNNLESKYMQDILGDIVISIPKVKEQAVEYEHSFERELAYMLVHGFYHLMGYDHIEESDKIQMREKEENILSKLNITR